MNAPFSPVALLGVGRAGAAMLNLARAAGVPAEACLALFSRHQGETVATETGVLSLTPGALDRSDSIVVESLAGIEPGLAEAVRRTCAGRQWILLLTGLGGRTGSTLAPLVAADARQVCPRVLAFASVPGVEEGGERLHRARRALTALAAHSAGTFALHHELLPESGDAPAPLSSAYQLPGRLLADSAHGLWRLLCAVPVLRLHADEFCQHLRGPACRTFAAVEAAGAERAEQAATKLLAHPLLAGGSALRQSRVVLGIAGGADLTRAHLRHIVQRVEGAAEQVRVVVSAATLPDFQDRLCLTLFARPDAATAESHAEPAGEPLVPARLLPGNESAGAPALGTRTQSHYAEATRVETSVPATRRRPARPQQVPLPLEMHQRGRFERKEPTMHNGETLDLPTYIRRGSTLN
jgi:cell division protein FtsZ